MIACCEAGGFFVGCSIGITTNYTPVYRLSAIITLIVTGVQALVWWLDFTGEAEKPKANLDAAPGAKTANNTGKEQTDSLLEDK